MVRAIILFCLATAVCGAVRKVRPAGATPTESRVEYSWIVSLSIKYRRRSNHSDPDSERKVQSYECTGSFIDIYGSVVTAAHCVNRSKICQDDYEEDTTCKLQGAFVEWRELHGSRKEKIVPAQIKRFERRKGKKRIPREDVAMIYLSTFRRSKMKCGFSAPQPIRLAPITSSMSNRPQDGIFAGFGAEPKSYSPKDNSIAEYGIAVNLSKISLKYHRHSKTAVPKDMFQLTPRFLTYPAKSEDSSLSTNRHPNVKGACEGDSGGPYMVIVKGFKGMRLRGILHGSMPYNTTDQVHDCAGFETPNIFLDVNHQDIRRWIRKELNERYRKMHVSSTHPPDPATCP